MLIDYINLDFGEFSNYVKLNHFSNAVDLVYTSTISN